MRAEEKMAPAGTGAGVHPAYSKYAPFAKHIVAEINPFGNEEVKRIWETEE